MDTMGAGKVSRKHLQRKLDERANAYKEDVAREVKTYGQVRPVEHQTSSRTWKGSSRIRVPSRQYRDGYDKVNWDA